MSKFLSPQTTRGNLFSVAQLPASAISHGLTSLSNQSDDLDPYRNAVNLRGSEEGAEMRLL